MAIKALCTEYKFRIVYLPAYSPELNPCELVFNVMKNHIRNCRKGLPIWTEVIIALGKIDLEQMKQFYGHCINPDVILPDIIL